MAKHRKPKPNAGAKGHPTAFEKAWNQIGTPAPAPPTVSGRWLLGALGVAAVAAAACCWGALCLLFWQGSWQLLYHPDSAVTRTPAAAGLAFDAVSFAPDSSAAPQLTAWWIPANARAAQLTVLYLHGQDGNLANAVGQLASLHGLGVNIFAIDYRGYGQSRFEHPGESRWREDADSALAYLTGTRHVAAGAIVLFGDRLGADLALEVAAAHPELAGVILRDPLSDPAGAILGDPRARLVPARWLVRDRYDQTASAAALRLPLLWLVHDDVTAKAAWEKYREVFAKIDSPKTMVELKSSASAAKEEQDAVARWLGDLRGNQLH